MSIKTKFTCAAALFAVALVSTAWTQESTSPRRAKPAATANEVKPNDVSGPMQLKLRYAQKVLEGVATEDFDLVAKNAQTLGLLAQDENWQVYQTPEYRQHSADFQRRADELAKAAKAKNVDGAAIKYLELTMCCVNCHKYTRDIQSKAK